jgi:hypothetical protein
MELKPKLNAALPEQLKQAAFQYREYLSIIDLKTTTIDDVFRAAYWRPVADKLGKDDLIRICSSDRGLDFYLRVVAKSGNQVKVERFPKLPAAIAAAARLEGSRA